MTSEDLLTAMTPPDKSGVGASLQRGQVAVCPLLPATEGSVIERLDASQEGVTLPDRGWATLTGQSDQPTCRCTRRPSR
jgi:hypothetical protein